MAISIPDQTMPLYQERIELKQVKCLCGGKLYIQLDGWQPPNECIELARTTILCTECTNGRKQFRIC